MARIIPVIDVMGGQVVRAIGGRREEYRPLVSRLCGSAEPLGVASTLVKLTDASELYVADLDAIRGHPTLHLNCEVLKALTALGPTVWVDAGVRDLFDETELLKANVNSFVVGTETANGDDPVATLAGLYGGDRVILGIDIHAGRLLGNWRAWGQTEVEAFDWMIELARGMGIRRVIVLNLAQVGSSAGPRTLAECRVVKARYPSVELWSGGGVRDWDDVKRLEDAGVDGVLVASALHDGTLTFPRRAS